MALKHATATVAKSEPVAEVAPIEQNVQDVQTETAAVAKDRKPWTAEKVRAVKMAVKDNPGITLDALLAHLREGFLAEHLEGAQGRTRLINLIKSIRDKEEKATAAGTEFTPMPEVVMPETVSRPNLLEW